MKYKITHEIIGYNKKTDEFMFSIKDEGGDYAIASFEICDEVYEEFMSESNIEEGSLFKDMFDLLFKKPELFKDDKLKQELINNNIYVSNYKLGNKKFDDKDVIKFARYTRFDNNYRRLEYTLNLYGDKDSYITIHNKIDDEIVINDFDSFKLMLNKLTEKLEYVDDVDLKNYPFYLVSELYKLIKMNPDVHISLRKKNYNNDVNPVNSYYLYAEKDVEENVNGNTIKSKQCVKSHFIYDKKTAREILRNIRSKVIL